MIFLSYAHAPYDERVCSWLLESMEVSSASVWRDLENLRDVSGEALNKAVAEAIDESTVFVALTSSQYVTSRYCQSEVIYALQNNVKVLRIDLEPISRMPKGLLPLVGYETDAVQLHTLAQNDWLPAIIEKLATRGLHLSRIPVDPMEFDSNARVIRPSYDRIMAADERTWRAWIDRLVEARSLNPSNGYTNLSLALLWLQIGDTERAEASAKAAVDQIPRDGDAHFALALTMCGRIRAGERTLSDVEAVLRRLAVARRLTSVGSHVDLLSALVIFNYYTVNSLKPPAEPEEVASWAFQADRRFDPLEIARVRAVEQVLPQHPDRMRALLSRFT